MISYDCILNKSQLSAPLHMFEDVWRCLKMLDVWRFLGAIAKWMAKWSWQRWSWHAALWPDAALWSPGPRCMAWCCDRSPPCPWGRRLRRRTRRTRRTRRIRRLSRRSWHRAVSIGWSSSTCSLAWIVDAWESWSLIFLFFPLLSLWENDNGKSCLFLSVAQPSLVIHPYVFVGMLYIMFLGFQRAHGFLALMVGATVSLMLAGSTALMLFVLLKWLLVGRPPSHTIHAVSVLDKGSVSLEYKMLLGRPALKVFKTGTFVGAPDGMLLKIEGTLFHST